MAGAQGFTVLGGEGFIGRRLRRSLEERPGASVFVPTRAELEEFLATPGPPDMGHVFYCIGRTADFRTRPFDTVEAHVCLLRRVLQAGRFLSLTYLSSTRVYEGATDTSEGTALSLCPANPGHLYNLSKVMGEMLCHAAAPRARVVRLSNVFGDGMPPLNFLAQLMREAAQTGSVRFLTAPNSAKDFVSVEDVVHWLPEIALRGVSPTYNIASGYNISNARLAELFEREGVKASFSPASPEWVFPLIDTGRLLAEFGCAQHALEAKFASLLAGYLG